MTLSIMTVSIISLSIMTLSIMTLSIMTLSIMTLSIMTVSIMSLSIMTVSMIGNHNGLDVLNYHTDHSIERANIYCQALACTRQFEMGLSSAESVLNKPQIIFL